MLLGEKVKDNLAYSIGDYIIWNKHYVSHKIRKTVFCRGICSSWISWKYLSKTHIAFGVRKKTGEVLAYFSLQLWFKWLFVFFITCCKPISFEIIAVVLSQKVALLILGIHHIWLRITSCKKYLPRRLFLLYGSINYLKVLLCSSKLMTHWNCTALCRDHKYTAQSKNFTVCRWTRKGNQVKSLERTRIKQQKIQVRKKALHELSHFLLIFNLKLLYTRDKTGSINHTLDEKQNERSETVERIWREEKEPYYEKMDRCSAIFSQRMNNTTMCQATPSSECCSCPLLSNSRSPTMNNTKLYNQCSFLFFFLSVN